MRCLENKSLWQCGKINLINAGPRATDYWNQKVVPPPYTFVCNIFSHGVFIRTQNSQRIILVQFKVGNFIC